MPSQQTIQDWLMTQIAELLYIDPEKIDIKEDFTSFGLSSRDAVMLSGELEEWLDRRLSPTLIYEYPTIISLSNYLDTGEVGATAPEDSRDQEAPPSQPDKLPNLLATIGDQIKAQLSDIGSNGASGSGGNLRPLSHGQRAMWFQHQVAPDSIQNPFYTVRVLSPLDVPLLRNIFQTIVNWHDSLRMTFELHEGEPVYRVHDEYESFFVHEDANEWSEEELTIRLKEETDRPFDLERGPLFRVYVFTRSETDYVLMFAAHHIIIDLWSMAIILNELSILYPGVLDGSIDLDKIPSPHKYHYDDFVRWQEKMLPSRKGEKLWRYWSETLAGDLPVLELQPDRPRPPVQTFNGRSLSYQLDMDLTNQLKGVAKQHGVTLFHILVATYNTLLFRYTGQEDLIVGAPMIGRSKTAFTGVVGYFVNPVALRTQLNGDMKFSDLLLQIRKTVLEAISKHDYPFSLLVEKLHPERDPRHLPIFQTMFVYQKTHPMYDDRLSKFALDIDGLEMELAGLKMETMSLEKDTAAFDLTFMMAEMAESVGATITYNTDLFDESTISRLWWHYKKLLLEIVVDAERAISEIPILTDEELNTLLVQFNNTRQSFPEDECIHQLFENQVVRTPEAVAVSIDNNSITYGELNRRANRLAHYLKAMGVGPDTVVGLFVERSLEMIVGMLAVLKAGGAYVPMDPVYPMDRLAFMLQDARVPILLTQSSLMDRLPTLTCRVLYLDKEWESTARKYVEVIYNQSMDHITLDDNPSCDATPDNLAYVIYTSGSTGRSKGVMVQHRGVSNLVNAQTKGFGITAKSRVLQFASISFDASVSEVFMTLLNGARLVLARRETLLSAPDLQKLLEDQEITTVTLPPSLLSLLPAEELTTLETVISAGESCPPEIGERWSRGRRFYNAYGPTECTIGPTYFLYNDSHLSGASKKRRSAVDALEEQTRPASIPIGQPIDNTQIYLLDKDLQPVPLGVPGEICIGGVGLARGYLGRPEMTSEKFIPNPFSIEHDERLYRTGDLGRFLPDGNIEFIGRTDYQVKVRGFRIELGEIESILNNHRLVKQSVVVLQGDDLSNKKLAAYVIPEDNTTLSVNDLRDQVRKYLPEYMMPSGFKIMDYLPLNASGKVDRRRLPDIDADPREREAAYVPPQTGLERNIAAIWQEVLKVEIVGMDDNFFDLGGHSLLMTKAHVRLQQVLEQEFSIIELFSHPTVRSLAEFVNQDGSSISRVKVSFGRADKQRDALKRQKGRLESIARGRSMIKDQLDREKQSLKQKRTDRRRITTPREMSPAKRRNPSIPEEDESTQ
jgi:amino acid adenylation domain-containing protein